MSVSRRQFVSRSIAAVGLLLLGAVSIASAEQQWKDVVRWDHAWDAADAVTYNDDGVNYKMPPAVRVDTVPDSISDFPMIRDKIDRVKILGLPQLPGTLYQKSNSMFGGRPSWLSDTVVPHDPETPSYSYSHQSGLFAEKLTAEGKRGLFRWPQPWWGAVLVRGVGPFGGHNQAYIDGNPGMVTISRSARGTVMVRSWLSGSDVGRSINSRAMYEENTALVQWHANGTDSWLEVNYRGADGVLVTKRVEGEIGNRRMDDLHSGFTHTNYTSSIGIAKGIPTKAQTDAVRNWAAPFIPDAEAQ